MTGMTETIAAGASAPLQAISEVPARSSQWDGSVHGHSFSSFDATSGGGNGLVMGKRDDDDDDRLALRPAASGMGGAMGHRGSFGDDDKSVDENLGHPLGAVSSSESKGTSYRPTDPNSSYKNRVNELSKASIGSAFTTGDAKTEGMARNYAAAGSTASADRGTNNKAEDKRYSSEDMSRSERENQVRKFDHDNDGVDRDRDRMNNNNSNSRQSHATTATQSLVARTQNPAAVNSGRGAGAGAGGKSTSTTASTTASSTTSNKASTSSSKRSLRFLIVDDSAPTRKVVTRILTSQKHIVTEAADGVECVQAIESAMRMMDMIDSRGTGNRTTTSDEKHNCDGGTTVSSHPLPDVIMIDDNMPNMNGPAATKRVRELGYRGTIVGVTGNLMDDDVRHFKAQGADEVLPKPLNMAALQQILRNRGQL
jgi:CheY-like chemotaxis protein